MKASAIALSMILALYMAVSFNAHAQDDVDLAITRLFETINMEYTVDKSIRTMVASQVEANPIMKDVEDEFLKFMIDTMSWKQLEPDIRVIYRKSFTKEEILAIVDFYQTPAGKKAITLMPTLMAEGAKLGQAKVQQKLPAFMKSIEPKLKAAQKKAQKN